MHPCSFPFLPLSRPDELSRNDRAAQQHIKKKKLLDQHKSPDKCTVTYTKSHFGLLYALQDDVLQKGNSFMKNDGRERSLLVRTSPVAS
jgi:hypothetical protein